MKTWELNQLKQSLPKTRENVRYLQKLTRNKKLTLKRIFTYKEPDPEKRFSKSELYNVMLLHQMPPYIFMWSFSAAFVQGSAMFLVVYFLTLTFMVTPLTIMFTFLSIYTRKGFFSLWNAIPIFRGLGYTVALHEISEEIYNINSFAALSLNYLWITLLYGHIWEHCNFDYPKDIIECIPVGFNGTITECPKSMMLSSQLYMRHVVLNEYTLKGLYDDKWGTFLWRKVVFDIITWLFMGYCLIHGIFWFQQGFVRRIMKFHKIYIGFIIVCAFFRARKHRTTTVLHKGIKTIFNLGFWSNTANLAMDRIGPGSTMYLSSLSPPEVTPVLLCIIISAKIFGTMLFGIILQAYTLRALKTIYGLPENDTCVTIRGKDILFAVIPDVLSSLPASRIFVSCYFVCMFFHSFGSAYFTMIGGLESLLQYHPRLKNYRVTVILIAMIVINIISLPFSTSGGATSLSYVWFFYGAFLVRSTLVSLATLLITCVYTVDRLEADYQFMYHKLPRKFWTAIWKVAPTILLMFMIIMLRTSIESFKESKLIDTVKIIVIVFDVLLLLPIIFVMLTCYWRKRKKKVNQFLIKPNEEWGPPDEELKKERKRYNPKKEMRYFSKHMPCNHNCLLKNSKFAEETITSEKHFNFINKQMKDPKS